jgi:hypothetical protein
MQKLKDAVANPAVKHHTTQRKPPAKPIAKDYQEPHHARELFNSKSQKQSQTPISRTTREDNKKRIAAFTEAVNRFRKGETAITKPVDVKPRKRSPLEEAKDRLDDNKSKPRRP